MGQFQSKRCSDIAMHEIDTSMSSDLTYQTLTTVLSDTSENLTPSELAFRFDRYLTHLHAKIICWLTEVVDPQEDVGFNRILSANDEDGSVMEVSDQAYDEEHTVSSPSGQRPISPGYYLEIPDRLLSIHERQERIRNRNFATSHQNDHFEFDLGTFTRAGDLELARDHAQDQTLEQTIENSEQNPEHGSTLRKSLCCLG